MKTFRLLKILTTVLGFNFLTMAVMQPVFADGFPPPIDQVSFSLTAQEWAKTDSAKVTVVVNAAMDKNALAKMREQIMSNLNKIAKGNWHITDFERSQDSSGLEKLYVQAEARVNESDLTNVNAQAQAISKSGANYKIQNIDFSPSVADIEKVKKSLRETLYREALEEMVTLNHIYPEQKYSLHNIRFGEFVVSIGVRPQMMMVSGGASRTQENVANNTVSNLITLTGDVELASNRLLKPTTKE